MRCVFAALIKSCTIRSDILVSSLLKLQVREKLLSITHKLSEGVLEAMDPTTRALFEAMDWDESLPKPEELNDIAEEVFCEFSKYPGESKLHTSSNVEQNKTGTDYNFKHSAPVGRLFSVISMRLSKMRTPLSITALW